MPNRSYPLLLALLIFCLPAFSQLALEFDINKKPAGSEPQHYTELDGKIYFAADDTSYGNELWVHDPVTGTTERISDIRPDSEGSIGSGDFFAYEGRLYFSANNRLNYYEPATGIINAPSTAGAKSPFNYNVINGKIYFEASSSGSNTRIFRFDPATDVIELLIDLNPDVDNDLVGTSFVLNGLLYFSGNDQLTGLQLWTYDPNDDSLERITDVAPDDGGGAFNFMTPYEDKIFYRGQVDPDIGREFYEFNLTTGDIRLIADIRPGFQSSDLIGPRIIGDQMIFRARPGLGGDYYNYIYDITADELEQLDLSPFGLNTFYDLDIYNGKVIGVGEGDDYGFELFEFDVDSRSFTLIKEFNPGPESTLFQDTYLIGDDLYISTFEPSVDLEVFKYNFNDDAFSLVADVNMTTASSEPYEFTPYAGKLYFGADEQNTGTELWVYDPQAGTTKLVKDFFPGAVGSNPSYLTAFDDKLFLRGRFGFGEVDLAFYEESTDSIYRADEVFGGENPENHHYSVVLGDKLYFGADDENEEDALYRYNPGTQDIEKLLNIKIKRTFVHGGVLFLTFEDPSFGVELFYYDEANNEIKLAADIFEGEDSSEPNLFTAFEDKIFFVAYEQSTSFELRSYNLSTEELKTYAFNNNNTNIETMAVYDGHLYLSAAEFGNDIELYRFDDATESLLLVQELVAGSSGGRPRDMVAFNDKLIFSAENDEFGRELWEYDSATDTAMIIADIWPGPSESEPLSLTLFNDKIYFAANNGTQGSEIWSLAECLNAFLTTTPDLDNSGNGAIDLSVSGGTPPYEFSWSNEADTEDINDLSEGSYSVTITDQSSCITTIEGRVDFASALHDLNISNIEIFPNPATDLINIQNIDPEISRIKLHDVYGRPLAHVDAIDQQLQLDLSAYPAGLYILEFFGGEKLRNTVQRVGTRTVVLTR